MATQEEILEKYKEDRLDKILRLQRILSSRIAQDAKSKASKVNDVSVISTTLTIDDIFSTEELKKILSRDVTTVDDLKSQIKPVRKEIIDRVSEKLGSPDSTVIFLIITCELINTSVDSEKEKISCTLRVRDQLYVKEPNKSSENLISSGTDSGTSAVEWVDASSFEEISKQLSIVSYPTVNLQKSNKFLSWLTDIQSFYKRYEELPPFESIPILVHSELSLRDFNLIFPKPEGLTNVQTPDTTPPTPPGIGESGATGTSGIGGATGTSGIGGATGTSGIGGATGTSGIGGATGTGETNGGETGTTTSVGTSGTSGNSKYLSIEAIKDDDPVITADSDGSAKITVISTSALEDTDQYWIGSETAIIRSENVEQKKQENPLPNPIGDNNSEVPKKEKEEIVNKTEAQQKAEESDALKKQSVKKKSKGKTSGADKKTPEGKQAKVDENKQKTGNKKTESSAKNTKPEAKTFLEWHKSDGAVNPSDPGIFYRGNVDYPYQGDVDPSYKAVPRKYKNLFNFGRDLGKMFGNLKFESPIDVGLALNGIQVGLFNKQIPYLFVEGSEVEAAFIPDSAILKKESGGIGPPSNANWGNEPFWCGYFTNFVLFNNNRYKSDASLSDIAATNAVYKSGGRYDKSPVDTIDSVQRDKLSNLNKDVDADRKDLTKKGGWNEQLAQKTRILNDAEKKLTRLKDKEGTTEVSTKQRQAQIDYDKALNEKNIVQNKVNELNGRINQKVAESEIIQKNIQTSYNPDNNVAGFLVGYHISLGDNSLTARGRELWDKIKDWPGGYIVTAGGHVEVLLHFSKTGKIYTLGGNTGISSGIDSKDLESLKLRANPAPETSGKVDRNGYQYGFKVANSPGGWSGGSDLFIVKRGVSKPYTKGIGVGLIKTDLWKEYEKIVKNNSDNTVSGAAYNVIKDIFV